MFRTILTSGAVAALMTLAAPAIAGDDIPVPLIDLGDGTYKGATGGLYPNGANVPPPVHFVAALEQAAQIVPRNQQGAPNPRGLIGFISIGMSNTNQEFGAFEFAADPDGDRNARIIMVNTAQGGQDSTTIANPDAPYWTNVDEKIAAAGLSPGQVQVCWLKEAKANPVGDFPQHALELREELETIAQILRSRFPNLRICYLASRTYGGYAVGTLNPEPYAYESGFSVKWLIEDQILGDAGLNYGHLPGEVNTPLLLWGPYLWANGAEPNGQGTFWLPEDFEQGGTNAHPSPAGEQKVANLIRAFLALSPSAEAWWPKQPGARIVALDATDDAYVRVNPADGNFGDEPALLTAGGDNGATTYARFDGSEIDEYVAYAKLGLRVEAHLSGGAAIVRRVPNSNWSEDTITHENAPGVAEVPEVVVPGHSRGGYVSARVTSVVANDANGIVSFAVDADPDASPNTRGYQSRESGQAPRVIITVAEPLCDGDVNGDGVVSGADLGIVLGAWGSSAAYADLDGNGLVDGADLGLLLGGWGPCN